MWPLESNWEQKFGLTIDQKQSREEQNDRNTLSAWEVQQTKFNHRRVNDLKQNITKDDFCLFFVSFLTHHSVKIFKGEEPNGNLVKRFDVKDAILRIKPEEGKSEEIKEVNETGTEDLKVTNNFCIDSKVYKAGDIDMSIIPKRLPFYC